MFNYHTHTYYCDGSDGPMAYVEEASSQGLQHLGFSGHAPLKIDLNWTMTKNAADEYCKEIRSIIENKNNLHVFLGMEADYAPGISKDFNELKSTYKLDFIIGSVHLVYAKEMNEYWFIDGPVKNFDAGLRNLYNNDIRKAVSSFFYQTIEMINTQKFDIIGHLDKIRMNNNNRFFNAEEAWYKDLVNQTLENIKPEGPVVEVNMRGIYKNKSLTPFPELWVIKECKKRNIRMTISTDAHSPKELSLLYNDGISLLKIAGYNEIWFFTGTEWQITGI